MTTAVSFKVRVLVVVALNVFWDVFLCCEVEVWGKYSESVFMGVSVLIFMMVVFYLLDVFLVLLLLKFVFMFCKTVELSLTRGGC